MKSEFILKTFTDDHFMSKLEFLTVLEAAFDDHRNELPDTLRIFDGAETFPLGKSVRVLFEVIDD